MNKCPSCKSLDVHFLDSSDNIRSEPAEAIKAFDKWEQYDCANCGALLEVENGYITVKKAVGLEYKTMMRYSVNWEKKIEESFNHG